MVKQAVKVVIRARPTASFASKNIKLDPLTGTIAVSIDKREDAGVVNNQTDSWKFKFEKILNNASQDEVYETSTQELVTSVVQGYNGTIMCYGQTGAGKTFTMSGSSTEYKYRGIVPRAIAQVYHEIAAKFDQAITIRVSYIEIYNEMMFDLLSSVPTHEQNASNLQIRETPNGQTFLAGASMVRCDTEEDALNCLFEGELARTVAAHQLNQRSSRSHTVLTVHIESRSRVESTDKVVNSKLNLVDLAGSERTKKTGSSGLTLKEATYINKSLSFLEQVVIALSSNVRDHIPYRQSRLTNLLRDSLGGNCKTVMIANIWPEASHLEETIGTLKFATRMMRVSNEAIVNVTLDKHLMIKRYEKEVRDLKQELAMHDTLKNRGRITYDQYTPDQLGDIKQVASQFLAGEIDEITDFDSLRKVREYFTQIKNTYRKLKQNVEAMQRQIESDPHGASKLQSHSALGGGPSKDGDQQQHSPSPDGAASEEEKAGQKKRAPIDKQAAFVEYKTQSEDGKSLEGAILQYREEVKEKKNLVKTLTVQINATKQEMDRVQERLISKQEEKRAANARGEDYGFDDEGAGNNDIVIDEEELTHLREMKDLKRNYRETYDKLRQVKSQIVDSQNNVDNMKQQIVIDFERWYAEEFDVPANGDHTFMASTALTNKLDTHNPGDEMADEDAETFLRAKRHIDTLHKAKKLEKARPTGYKK